MSENEASTSETPTGNPLQAESAKKPFVFISHKTEDKEIADVITTFLLTSTAGNLEVFQSTSSASSTTATTGVGRSLDKQLRENVGNANVLILLYTHPDKDWNYCMYELGIAADISPPETKIIILQFGHNRPRILTDLVHINVWEQLDIQKFVTELLTSRDFFPGFPDHSVTTFAAGTDIVNNSSKDLFEKLQAYTNFTEDKPEWAAFPYAALQIDNTDLLKLSAGTVEQRTALFHSEVINKCVFVVDDKVGTQILGMAAIKDRTLPEVIAQWKELNPNDSTSWVDSIYQQLSNCAASVLPALGSWEWHLVPDGTKTIWYAPVVASVSPKQINTVFELYFVPFKTGQNGPFIQVMVPESMPGASG
jgi:hypothetical protein